MVQTKKFLVMNNKIKICFLADKHELFDDRIYWKMAVPLKEKGYEIHYLLIRNEAKIGITKEGINYEILKLKTFSKNQYLNFILKLLNPNNNYKKLFNKAKKLNADVYHFHDLWINRIGRKLKKLPQKPVVFYDAREPYAEDYVSFSSAQGLLKKIVLAFSNIVDYWEKRMSGYYDLIISNEIIVRDKFRRKLGFDKAEVIYNYTDFYNKYEGIKSEDKKYDFIYCGGITESRGAFKILKATQIVKKSFPDVHVIFVGKYSPNPLRNELNDLILKLGLANNVELHSQVEYKCVSHFYNQSRAGLITWLPEKALTIKLPIKIFEYMAFGLPMIGSNFGHIKKYIEQEDCGLIVNPIDSHEISAAMKELLSNKELYDNFSKNARNATLKKYKWENELNRLLGFYIKFLNERANHG